MKPSGPKPVVLDYSRPEPAPQRFKFHVAATFGAGALLLGLSWAFWAAVIIVGAWHYKNPRDFYGELSDGLRLLTCAVLLIVPGAWYGRIGIRGLSESGC